MSVAVSYKTSKPVVKEIGDGLIAEAEAAQPLLWYEPIKLFVEGEYPAVVRGWSKCPPMSVHVNDGSVMEIDESDWRFMDYWDSRRLFGDLSAWSKKYEVDWILTVEGDTIGKIKAGKLSWGLRRQLGKSARAGSATRNDAVDATRANELCEKYRAL